MMHALRVSLVGAAVLIIPAVACAALRDEPKKAAPTAAQQSQKKVPQGGQSSGGGSLSSALGATDLHGLTDYNGCMAQTAGGHERLTAQVLQRKLNSSTTLSPQERQRIEEDVRWLNAKAADPRAPAPDPKQPQRYLLAMTDEEQMEVSGAYGRFANEVRAKCEAQYGGMSQFGDPSGRRRAPIDTRVPFPDLLHAAAPAHRPTAAEQRGNCMDALTGLRWQLMAERMEQKLQSLLNVPAQERRAWEEDIAVVRAAQQSGAKTMPQSPDPNNPMRYLTRLTPQDQIAMAQEQATRMQQLLASCNGGSAAGTSSSASALAAMHEQRRAGRNVSKNLDPKAAQAEAQAWLTAHPFTLRPSVAGSATQADYLAKSGTLACFDRQKGFRAHQTAERLITKRTTVASQDRQELEAWITAWRAAEQAGKDEPAPISTNNAQGWLRFLTGADQQELNLAYSALSNRVREECNAIDHMEVRKNPKR